jgi:tetratricopeptide (TPR) repeat protein
VNNPPDLQKRLRLARIISLALGLVTFFLYFPVRNQDFQRMDDPDYVYQNPHVTSGLTTDNAAWAFTHSHSSNWHPLTWLSHMLDCQLFGLNAGAHHLVNAALHAINSALLLLLLFRYFYRHQSLRDGSTGRLSPSRESLRGPGGEGNRLACSTFVAALFALHPLHVESVAWIAERKDVLSTLFWILTIWAYFRYTDGKDAVSASLASHPRKDSAPKLGTEGLGPYPVSASLSNSPQPKSLPVRDRETRSLPEGLRPYHGETRSLPYVTSLVLFILGLMSKPMLVTLPFTLLLLDFWPLRRLNLASGSLLKSALPLVVEKIPFFVLAIASSVVTLLVQGHSGAVVSLNDLPLTFRLENVAISYIRYLKLMFVPVNLSVFYPLPKVIPIWEPLAAVALLVGITIFAIRKAKSQPYVLFGWLWYLGTLIPVIGLIKAGEQAIADRYTYVPLIGIFIALAWLLNDLANRFTFRKPLFAFSSAAILACALLTHAQIGYWKNSRTLYEHAAKATTHNYAAMMILGGMLWEEGKLDEAKTDVLEGLKDAPHSPDLHNGLGFILIAQRQFDEALPHFEEALRFAPNLASAWYGRGYCLLQQKRYAESESSSARAWELNPAEYKAGLMLALALQNEKKSGEAEAIYRKLLAQKPNWAPALRGLAGLMAESGKTNEAIDYYAQSLKTEPNDPEALNGLAAAFATSGRINEAIQRYQSSLKINSSQSDVHCHLAELLSAQGQAAQAIEHYRESLKIDPGLTIAANNLAWILATNPDPKLRNGQQAAELAETACKQSEEKVPFLLGTLAAAYAEAGRFEDAIKTAKKARDLATAQGLNDVAARNSELLMVYESGRPFHETIRK